ncbi:MAG: hypothetical protein WDN28_07540 [Chthoniobacter sp.]
MSTLEAFLHHPIETLERALHIRKQIAELEEVLKELFGPTPVSLAGVQVERPRRKPKKLAKNKGFSTTQPTETAHPVWAAQPTLPTQKKRVAKVTTKTPRAKATPATGKKKRKLSPEARARIVAAAKARWARAKKAK